jgi:hypothetical protein
VEKLAADDDLIAAAFEQRAGARRAARGGQEQNRDWSEARERAGHVGRG